MWPLIVRVECTTLSYMECGDASGVGNTLMNEMCTNMILLFGSGKLAKNKKSGTATWTQTCMIGSKQSAQLIVGSWLKMSAIQVKFLIASGKNWGDGKALQSGALSAPNVPQYENLASTKFIRSDGFLSFIVNIADTRTDGSAGTVLADTGAMGIVKFDDDDTVYYIDRMCTINTSTTIDVFCHVSLKVAYDPNFR